MGGYEIFEWTCIIIVVSTNPGCFFGSFEVAYCRVRRMGIIVMELCNMFCLIYFKFVRLFIFCTYRLSRYFKVLVGFALLSCET